MSWVHDDIKSYEDGLQRFVPSAPAVRSLKEEGLLEQKKKLRECLLEGDRPYKPLLTSREKRELREAGLFGEDCWDPPSFFGQLVLTDYGRTPDSQFDAFGRSVLGFICDPACWVKLNNKQMQNLHAIDTIESVVQAGCRWDAADKLGRTPWSTAPFWLKKYLVATHRRLFPDRDPRNV